MADGRLVCYDPYITLDGILAWAWMSIHHPDALQNSDPLRDGYIEAELPLERRGSGDDWYWACSFGLIEAVKEETAYWNRRVDFAEAERYVDFRGRRGKINASSGRYKAYRMPIPVQLVSEITWTAEGDAEEIRRLLRVVTHIGKKRSQGYGLVGEWIVEEIPGEWSEWVDGRPTRAIPIDGSSVKPREGVRIGRYGIRPIYWHPDTHRLCYLPA